MAPESSPAHRPRHLTPAIVRSSSSRHASSSLYQTFYWQGSDLNPNFRFGDRRANRNTIPLRNEEDNDERCMKAFDSTFRALTPAFTWSLYVLCVAGNGGKTY